MRKKIFIFLVIFIILLSGCYSDGSIIGSLPKYKNKEFYSDNSVQDFTNFGKYEYEKLNDSDFENSEYFTKVAVEDIERIKSYVENFQSVVDSVKQVEPESELVKKFSFNVEIIDENDYFYIKTREGSAHSEGKYGKFDNYSVYFVDLEKNILYYFHCDI
ncbi:MAG: hypothetical protein E7388_01010 [Ruminococcaceae bacterium]|nr:hypothetical protein [Oscillospiraceae bacterium]